MVDRIYIEVSGRAFGKARSGNTVNGKHGSIEGVWTRAYLGQEVEDLSNHADQTTEYRKFVGCTVEIAASQEDLKDKKVIPGLTKYGEPVWIFPKKNISA
jgi:hypothetical protein